MFCEDIRQEIGNKISLMGVFSSDIAFPLPPPVRMPKFGIVTWLIFDIGDEPKQIVVRVLAPPNRTEIAKVEGSAPGGIQFPFPPDDISKGTLRLVMPLQDIVFSEEGFLEVMVDMDGAIVRAGRLRIRLGVKPEEIGLPPIASSEPRPPSEQSPNAPAELSSQPAPDRRGPRVRPRRV